MASFAKILLLVFFCVALSSAASFKGKDGDFLGCMTKCLVGGDEHEQLGEVYQSCTDSPSCWGAAMGEKVQACASQCKEPAVDDKPESADTEVTSDVPEFLKCMAKCLGKSLAQIESWYKECKKNAKCWAKKAGFRALACVGKCIKAEETRVATTADVGNNFLKCMANCLMRDVAEILHWFEKCHLDVGCWLREAGLEAFKCAGKCLAVREEPIHLETTVYMYTEVTSDVPEFLKCMAKCLGKSLAQIESWYKECKKNAKCWAKKAGFRAIKCVGKCIKAEETAVGSTVGNSILECMAHCMKTDTSQIIKWYQKCHTDIDCWYKEAGVDAIKCAVECLKTTEPDQQIDTEVASDVPEFLKCMAKCLGESLAQIESWYNECKTNLKCWEKKAGFRALACVGKCIKAEETRVATTADVGNNFLECMANCLMQDVAEILHWFEKCHLDVGCWLKEAGLEASKCAKKCLAVREEPIHLETTVYMYTEVASDVPEFLKCMAKCLGRSLAQIESWYKECKKNAKCWAKKAGFRAIKCVGKCIKVEETRVATTANVGNNFLECMAHCLGRDVAEILHWFQKCHTNVGCWLREAGLEAFKCAGKCLAVREEPIHLETTVYTEVASDVPAFLKCMAKCLGKSLAQIESWYKECKKNAKCWAKKAGFRALACVGKCITAEETRVATTANVGNNFLECMAHCLGRDVAEILHWFQKCHTNVGCWLREAGLEAFKCAGQCLAVREEPINLEKLGNHLIECMAHCMKTDTSQIIKWYHKCNTDVDCWLREAGIDAIKCAVECLKTTEPDQQIVGNGIIECMAHCMKTDTSQIIKWFLKCHADVDCWIREAGKDVLKCAAKCHFKTTEPDQQIADVQSSKPEPLKFTSYEKVIELVDNTKDTSRQL